MIKRLIAASIITSIFLVIRQFLGFEITVLAAIAFTIIFNEK